MTLWTVHSRRLNTTSVVKWDMLRLHVHSEKKTAFSRKLMSLLDANLTNHWNQLQLLIIGNLRKQINRQGSVSISILLLNIDLAVAPLSLGFAGNIGAIEVWLIDLLFSCIAPAYKTELEINVQSTMMGDWHRCISSEWQNIHNCVKVLKKTNIMLHTFPGDVI